jgi:hypothetical protein
MHQYVCTSFFVKTFVSILESVYANCFQVTRTGTLRFILDPADVKMSAFHSVTFEETKHNEDRRNNQGSYKDFQNRSPKTPKPEKVGVPNAVV